MWEIAVVVCGTVGTWVLLSEGRAARIRHSAERSVRRRLPVGVLLRGLGGVCGAVVAVAVFGILGGLAVAGVCAVLLLRSRRARPDRLPVTSDLPVVIGLLAAGIRAGATVPGCLGAVSRAARGPLGAELAVVAERLRLGADPAQAWQRSALPEQLTTVGRDLARATDTGAPVADLLDRYVADVRRALRLRTMARVERLGVLVVAPLGLCFLPAFVLIGIVPMAVDLLSSALG